MQSEKAKTLRNLTIGTVNLNSRVVLAPMADFTDTVLRSLVRKESKNCLLMSEMVSSQSLKYNNQQGITDYNEAEFPLSFQISGHIPEIMAEAAQKLEDKATFIDINMGCPAPKIVKNFDGVRLMTDLSLASHIITAVKNSVKIPVTVKCRLGWDCNTKNYLEFAKMAESSGADAIIIHGRTRSQMYSGDADWHAIAQVKQAVNIPVIGNGDIDSPEKAGECLQISGCDGIAVGRGILGDPGLIARIETYIEAGKIEPPPELEKRLKTALIHCQNEVEYRGEEAGIKHMRKFFAYYVKNIRNAGQYRFKLVRCITLEEVEKTFNEISGSRCG
ncbi:MAG: tRNA dihydrouridine synthase DusB [Candidatus Melainabacteria bacterium GWF2_37_15]|nr:MAG: tRNA dihydrouridine synthase DusB [Candidatus Melainabacteria bacterium GWF2_37_15]